MSNFSTHLLCLTTVSLFATACAAESETNLNMEGVKVLTANDLTYVPLNPARGDAAPQAGVLWGDIREDVPSGTLLRFADGFSSPPHIHNITYRGVVISGHLHNDDPNAAKMWMGPGSFWTQPAGEDHITEAKPGAPSLSFLEILEGPYLVHPSTEAFETDELPINLDSSNIVWLSADEMNWIDVEADGATPQMTFLWGSPEIGDPGASMLKLPSGFSGTLIGTDGLLRAVTVAGKLGYAAEGYTEEIDLASASYFETDSDIASQLSCISSEDCLLYIRTDGQFRLQ
jgi:hypothetical protein